MTKEPQLYKLNGVVQHYQWGGFDFIPELLDREKTGQPFAEYWLGAHPSQPAEVAVHGVLKKLDQLISEEKETIIGKTVAAKFGGLPYLLKVLDVRQMLSIQVHPDKDSAAAAFEAENKKGIAVNAPNRNYKDANHKPEAMVALSDFWLLHGFKPMELLQQKLQAVPELSFLSKTLESKSYRGLYELVMTMPDDEVRTILQPLTERLLPLYDNGALQKSSEDFWAARAAKTFHKPNVYDRGIFSIYFFNLVNLKIGEGIYQPAGMPHAYLEGQNVEIMAASDNVLRAGLTDKHIDISELMKHVRFEPTVPTVIKDDLSKEMIYKTAAAEFELHKIELKQHDGFESKSSSAEIFLTMHGAVLFKTQAGNLELKRGEAVLVTAGTALKIESHTSAQLFRATVPVM